MVGAVKTSSWWVTAACMWEQREADSLPAAQVSGGGHCLLALGIAAGHQVLQRWLWNQLVSFVPQFSPANPWSCLMSCSPCRW